MTGRRLEDGGIIISFVAVIAAALVIVAGMVYDGGQIVTAQALARDLAAEAARAGAQEIDIDTLRSNGTAVLDETQARAAVAAFLARTGHEGDARIDGATVSVTVRVRQHMRILPLADRIVSATDAATALTGEQGAAP